MSHHPGCPAAEELRRFLLGQTPEPQADTLEQHLSECRHCVNSLQALEAEDNLTAALRVAVPCPEAIDCTGVSDLTPLQGMPLTSLDLRYTGVRTSCP